MSEYLMTYDLQVASREARELFIESALNDFLTYVWQDVLTKTLFRLPASTFWTDKPGIATCEASFEDAVAATNARYPNSVAIEKLFITLIQSPVIKSDRRKQPEDRLTFAKRLPTCMAHQHQDPFFRY